MTGENALAGISKGSGSANEGLGAGGAPSQIPAANSSTGQSLVGGGAPNQIAAGDIGANGGLSAGGAPDQVPSGSVGQGQGLAGGGAIAPATAGSSTQILQSTQTSNALPLTTQLPSGPSPTDPKVDAPATATTSASGGPIDAPHTPTPLTSTDLAQSFNSGNQTGVPMSA
ncbi:MAG: hypothetical protein WCI46_15375, partial [Verrucomicrobiota bacterium]